MIFWFNIKTDFEWTYITWPRLLIDINTPEKDSDLRAKKNKQLTCLLIYIALETPGRGIIIQGP